MPLPDGGNTPWPPEHCAPINQQYATWAAWWTGDVDQLAAVYGGGGNGGTGRDTTGFFASESGGFRANVGRVVGAVRRWFWGSRASTTQQRTRLHVPLAGDIASASADLLFSEPPTFEVGGDRPATPAGDTPADPTQVRLDELIDGGTTYAILLEAAEICAAMGGVYLRVVWDPKTRPGRPWITAAQPDVAVPEWAWGQLTAVTFWRELSRKGRLVVRHLERHEPGRIIHGVYQGYEDQLGTPIPLTDAPETAGLADERLVDGNTILTGAQDRLTVVYVPNMRPNRVWRNNPHAAYLGRSDYSGVEPLMDALDLVWSSWVRDVDLGKARLVVPREYMTSHGKGQGASVDLDQEIYEPINAMAPETGGAEITQVQFNIRVAEHQSTVDSLKGQIVGSAGYSPQTFGLVDTVAITATEVAAKERRSLITRDRKAQYWRPELAAIVETLLWVDKAQFGSGIVPQPVDVEFADAVSVDPLAQAQTLQALHVAEAISIEEKVRTLHPDWTDVQVAEEVGRIKQDFGIGPLQDPSTFTGLTPTEQADPLAPPVSEPTGVGTSKPYG